MSTAVDVPPVALTSPVRSLRRAEWEPDESVPLAECTVGGLLRERAQQAPGACALVGTRHDGSPVRLTYGELLAEAERVAAGLLALAEPGEHVALWAPNVAEWPVVEYGAALAGLVLVALNPVLTDDELGYALRLSGAVVLVHAETSRDRDLAAAVARVRSEVPTLRDTVSLAHPDRLVAEGGDGRDRARPDDPAMIQFTSGTTGRPKAVLLAHRSLVNNARLTMITAEVEPGAVAVAPLPMFHTAACVISTLGPAWVTGTQVLIERFEPGPVLDTAIREEARVLFAVPTVLSALLEAARHRGGPAPRFDTVLVGASILPPVTIAAAEETFGAAVHNLFGQTELSPVLSLTRRGDTREDLATTVGRPLPQTAARIVDVTTGDVVGLGTEGEICARGYLQLLRYHADPDATAATVDGEGWVHTGDLGTMDDRGLITVTGRLKELIIRGGENIAPAEVEIALAEHPAVRTAAVVGLPDEHWGEVVAAAVVLRDELDDVDGALRAHCRERISAYKVPERWFVVDELPLTASGKVQKFVLRDQLSEAEEAEEADDAGAATTDSSTRSN